jgi:hypothetical protein
MKSRYAWLLGKVLVGAGSTRGVLVLAVAMFLLSELACGGGSPSPTATPTMAVQPSPTPSVSVFDAVRTAFGFTPSSPEITAESFTATLQAIGQYGDVILTMPQVPWAEFIHQPDGDSPTIEEMRNTLSFARQYGLETIFVIDPLQSFDRRRIATFPPELAGGNFGTPAVRQAFKNFALRLVHEFQPRYLGLASEINTYADAEPEDFANYLSLYHEVYAAIKSEAPETQIFVTFQWEDLNSVGPFSDDEPGRVKWEIVESFEPELDLWAISTYPYFAFDDGADSGRLLHATPLTHLQALSRR